jgi:alpha-D-xyloside xylohydrolase
VYPLFHTAAIYDGVRRDGVRPGVKNRALILSRDAYLGAQRNGTIFWTSDISPTWDTLRRQIPTGLNVAASGIAYTGNDIGGWQDLPYQHVPAHPPLIDPSGARDNVGHYDDYPELYVRWFEYGTFLPTMRTHGTRKFNEVWSYGPQAEPILEKYLKLRYTLMPYIYSLGWFTHQTGAPFMRALFMDFPADDKVSDIRDEYMFGPALLVAPVVQQGATTREVYLPEGTDWYNYWTNQKLHGGQTITVQAPIDTIPLFVRAGSILPLGVPVESTHDHQALQKIKVYAGADAEFTLYDDDGTTYAYENGDRRITTLRWNDRTGKLTQDGAAAWEGSETKLLEVIGR